MFCARCGEQIPDASEICQLCGQEATLRIDVVPPPPAPPPQFQSQFATPTFNYGNNGVQGVGGWLLMFCLGITMASPLLVFAQIANQPQGPNPYNLVDIVRVLYGIIVGIMLWTRRPLALMLLRIYFVVVLLTIVLVVLVFFAAALRTKNTFFLGRGIGSVLPLVIYSAIWFSYFRTSERVRNTYGATL